MSKFLIFYDDLSGNYILPLSFVSAVLFIGRIFDGITDLGIGIISDKLLEKGIGRHQIYFLFLPLFLISFLCLWHPFSLESSSSFLKKSELILTSFFFFISLTAISIPFDSFMGDIGKNAALRNTLAIQKALFAGLGLIIGSFFLGMPAEKGSWYFLIISTPFLLSGGFAMRFLSKKNTTKENSYFLNKKKKNFKINKIRAIFYLLLVFTLFFDIASNVFLKNLEYYSLYVINQGKTHDLEIIRTYLYAAFIISLIISLFFWGKINYRWPNFPCLQIVTLGLALTGLAYFYLPVISLPLLPVSIFLFAIAGFLFGGSTLLLYTIVAHFCQLDKRNLASGFYFSTFNFIKKMAIAFSAVIIAGLYRGVESSDLSYQSSWVGVWLAVIFFIAFVILWIYYRWKDKVIS